MHSLLEHDLCFCLLLFRVFGVDAQKTHDPYQLSQYPKKERTVSEWDQLEESHIRTLTQLTASEKLSKSGISATNFHSPHTAVI